MIKAGDLLAVWAPFFDEKRENVVVELEVLFVTRVNTGGDVSWVEAKRPGSLTYVVLTRGIREISLEKQREHGIFMEGRGAFEIAINGFEIKS